MPKICLRLEAFPGHNSASLSCVIEHGKHLARVSSAENRTRTPSRVRAREAYRCLAARAKRKLFTAGIDGLVV